MKKIAIKAIKSKYMIIQFSITIILLFLLFNFSLIQKSYLYPYITGLTLGYIGFRLIPVLIKQFK